MRQSVLNMMNLTLIIRRIRLPNLASSTSIIYVLLHNHDVNVTTHVVYKYLTLKRIPVHNNYCVSCNSYFPPQKLLLRRDATNRNTLHNTKFRSLCARKVHERPDLKKITLNFLPFRIFPLYLQRVQSSKMLSKYAKKKYSKRLYYRKLACSPQKKFRHPVGEIELSAAFCYELPTSGKSRPQRIPTSFDVPTSDGSFPKANQTIGLPLLQRIHVPISISECNILSFVRCSFAKCVRTFK
ncbi:hypothetical protein ANN_26127 [Periplaneta americana]|uniref:Uncharacterized protein n=1 Tax=Periplaneta americana TaxID=6978 RepID=A0ABQ8S5H4_PERAM|nr:hypothetical protein ANN_26127 [Periplaneta americana]